MDPSTTVVNYSIMLFAMCGKACSGMTGMTSPRAAQNIPSAILAFQDRRRSTLR